MLRKNLKIIDNRKTHPLTWLPKLNYIALNYIAKNNGPKNCQKTLAQKNYIFKYPTTKILFVIKKKKKKKKRMGMPRFQIISKIVLSIRNNNK